MNEQKVIAFVGMPGAGKGTCTNYLHDKYGWPVVHFGNMLYEEVQRRGLDNVKDETFVQKDLRDKEGPAVLAKHALKKARDYFKQGSTMVVLDGLYMWSEYKYLDQELGDNLIVIAITAPKKLRRQRVLERKDSHRSYTLEQLIKREVGEIENIEKGGPIAYADYTIVNDTTPEELILKIEHVLNSITPAG
ncbi:MAG TPA: AAA family ATPase [Candidatus Limnocylindrales bacterium]|nr:AAA family ATPase [Candidatus Limnocylindrales bacterium]